MPNGSPNQCISQLVNYSIYQAFYSLDGAFCQLLLFGILIGYLVINLLFHSTNIVRR